MSFRNRRRSLSHNTNMHSTIRRRSSITNAELEQVQYLLQKRKQLTASFVIFVISCASIFIFLYQIILSHKILFKEILTNEFYSLKIFNFVKRSLFNLTPWLATLLIIQFQLLFLWYLPGEEHNIVTVSGYKYKTKYNSFDSCVLICLLYLFGASIGLYAGDIIYKNWVGLMFVQSLLSILIQIYLFTLYEAKCLGESQIFLNNNVNSEQNIFAKIYFGLYLQPIIFEIDIKVFITNRITFTLWPLYVISSLYNQYINFKYLSGSLITCALLQLIYVMRRHWYEYILQNLDNSSDRMGFYRIWGVLVFLPTLYLTPITFLSQTKSSTSIIFCITIFIIGVIIQCLNTDINLQKYKFRVAKGIWKIGNKDPFYIEAKYRKENGELGTELLLGSGYWGKARHLNYSTEFITFLVWTLLTKFESPVNYFPVIFLVILLIVRMKYDEIRCLVKYTYHWLQYVERVPYKIIPGVI